MTRSLVVVAFAVLLPSSTPAAAQTSPPASPPLSPDSGSIGPAQVMSANPFGLLFELFNTEYERRATKALTVGIGGSTATIDTYDYDGRDGVVREERYVNGDIFFRYYPAGRAFAGRSFGVKVGLTRIPDQGSFFGVGFDANQSWLLNDHFYFGSGFGLKRLIGTDEEAFDLKYIPTLRINVGVAF